MKIIKDKFGDLLSVAGNGPDVLVMSCNEDGSMSENASDWLFTPKAARNLAKALERAADFAEDARG